MTSAWLVYQNAKGAVILGPVFPTRDEAERERITRNNRPGEEWSWVELGTNATFAGYILTPKGPR